jgi:hypothetical protein
MTDDIIENALLDKFFELAQKEHSLGRKKDEKLSAEIDVLIVKIREIKNVKEQEIVKNRKSAGVDAGNRRAKKTTKQVGEIDPANESGFDV